MNYIAIQCGLLNQTVLFEKFGGNGYSISMALALSVGAAFQRDDIIQTLIDYHYDRVGMVIEQGTYAAKGSIVDVFPTNQNQPIRLDFFSDALDRINSFRVDTQRTITKLDKTTILPVDVREGKRLDYDTRVLNSELMANIQAGDYVVHERYGIGIYKGFTRLAVGDQEGEYILIQFKGTDKLYMPLDQIPLIHRYSGSDARPRLNGLYDGGWERTRRQAHRALKNIAEDIYELFKKRQRVKGLHFRQIQMLN